MALLSDKAARPSFTAGSPGSIARQRGICRFEVNNTFDSCRRGRLNVNLIQLLEHGAIRKGTTMPGLLLAAHYLLFTPYSLLICYSLMLLTTCYLLHTTYYLLSTTYTIYCLLPTAYSLLLTTHYLLPSSATCYGLLPCEVI